jgi:hypothetical protein
VCVVPSVACVSVKGCRVGRDVGGEVDEGEREKVTAAARGGGSGRRLREGGVLPY